MKKNEGEIKLENKLYSKVFMWLFIGLLITFGGAMALLAAPSVCKFILGSNIYYAIFIAEIIIAIFLLLNKELYCAQSKKIIYAVLREERANNLINNVRFANKTFGGFLNGKIVDSLIIGILTFIVLSIFKIP